MAIDAYALCPCGSGKKFKWCCQPFYGEIEKAFAQHANGQFATALQLMEQLTKQHADNAEVWGRYAELLWENERLDEAEKAIDRALEINPNYAFGHYLRGVFRHNEGEWNGALLLYRKAMEVCSPEQHSLMADIALATTQCHILQQRPIAVRASIAIAQRYAPQEENVQKIFNDYFAEGSPYPAAARRELTLKPAAASSPAERREAWQRALANHTTGKITDAATAFEELTAADDKDASAWYNLAVTHAWLGDDRAALEAFDRYVALETDENAAADAWTLAEVVRFSAGMEEQSDWVQHEVHYTIRDPETVGRVLSKEKRLADPQQSPQRIAATLLDRELPAARDDLALFETPRVAAFLLLVRDQLILLNTDETMIGKARQILEPQLAGAVAGPNFEKRNAAFGQVLQRLLPIRLPAGLNDATAKRLIAGASEQWFEETWLNMPLKSLGNIPPVDAAGHTVLRRKVLGLIRFWEQLIAGALPVPYDFSRLRHKLGIASQAGAAAEDAIAGKAKVDISAMNAAELAAVQPAELSDVDLQLAFQTALRLDARDLAGRFAEQSVGRPVESGQADRFGMFNHLVQLAIDQADHTAAHSWLDAGLKEDCEHNEGRRRNDYELRRAQVHLRAKEPEQAFEVFERLIERSPTNLDLLGRATESMLTARQKTQATKFAEQGLARAKQHGDRDRVGYFEELLAAARKP